MSEASMTAEEARHIFGGGEPAKGQWQPIDTAPRDGTPVLIYAEHGDLTTFSQRVAVGIFHGEWNKQDGTPMPMFCYFQEWENGKQTNSWLVEATHWMPLPNPPGYEPMPIDWGYQ